MSVPRFCGSWRWSRTRSSGGFLLRFGRGKTFGHSHIGIVAGLKRNALRTGLLVRELVKEPALNVAQGNAALLRKREDIANDAAGAGAVTLTPFDPQAQDATAVGAQRLKDSVAANNQITHSTVPSNVLIDIMRAPRNAIRRP